MEESANRGYRKTKARKRRAPPRDSVVLGAHLRDRSKAMLLTQRKVQQNRMEVFDQEKKFFLEKTELEREKKVGEQEKRERAEISGVIEHQMLRKKLKILDYEEREAKAKAELADQCIQGND